MKSLEKMIAEKIAVTATNTVKNTVGKSIPVCIHEVKMPESIRAQYLNKENDK